MLTLAPLAAQHVTTPTILNRHFPAGSAWSSTKRIVSSYFTNQAVQCVFAINGSGALGYLYGPEFSTSFAQISVAPQVDLAALRDPGAEGVILTNGSVLTRLSYSAVTPPCTATTISTGPGWSVVSLETCRFSNATYVAGFAADLRSVKVGTLANATMTTVGSFTTLSDAKQLVFFDNDGSGGPEIAVRTTNGVEVHSSTGTLLAQYSAPNYVSTKAFLVRARNDAGTPDRLSWLHYDSVTQLWYLRSYKNGAVTQDLALDFMPEFPLRADVIGMAAGKVDGDAFDDIVIQQNKSLNAHTYNARLKGTSIGYETVSYSLFELPGTTQLVDTCPVILYEGYRSGDADLLAYQNHDQVLRVIQSLDSNDTSNASLLDTDALRSDSNTNFGLSWSDSDTPLASRHISLSLHVSVPAPYQNTGHRMQIVVWHQTVTNPYPTMTWQPAEPVAESNTIVNYSGNPKPVVNLDIKAPNATYYAPSESGTVDEPACSAQDHSYLMYRFVQVGANGTDITWASSIRMVGFNAARPPLGVSNYMVQISSPTGKPPIELHTKNVGLIKKPDQLDPPWPTGTTPTIMPTGGVTQLSTSATW